MKRANQFLFLGSVGLLASLANFRFSGMDDNPTPYLTPWIVFLIIGLVIRLRYVKK